MRKLSKKDIEDLREACSYGCEYTATEEVVNDIVGDILEELGADVRETDEIGLTDCENEFATLYDFVRIFWDKAVEDILNVIETQ